MKRVIQKNFDTIRDEKEFIQPDIHWIDGKMLLFDIFEQLLFRLFSFWCRHRTYATDRHCSKQTNKAYLVTDHCFISAIIQNWNWMQLNGEYSLVSSQTHDIEKYICSFSMLFLETSIFFALNSFINDTIFFYFLVSHTRLRYAAVNSGIWWMLLHFTEHWNTTHYFIKLKITIASKLLRSLNN